MTNAEKFKEVWGFEPNVTHCPKCGRESCMVCPYAEKRFEECASDWWKSEYERTPISDEELSKFIAEEMDKGSKLFKGAVCKVLEDVMAEIHKLAPERGMWEIDGDKVKEAVIETLIDVDAIIDRKINEVKGGK